MDVEGSKVLTPAPAVALTSGTHEVIEEDDFELV
jgi:hypothetical protein